MGILNKEAKNNQNPALGSLLLWRFAVGYAEGSGTQNSTPFPLLFTVLPIVFHESSLTILGSTLKASGLRAFASKFSTTAESKSDLLLSIHTWSLASRALTKASIKNALAANLLGLFPKEGAVVALSETTPQSKMAKSIQNLMKQTEKLGYWCGGVSMHEISAILKIGF
jgi:hypothetical protein